MKDSRRGLRHTEAVALPVSPVRDSAISGPGASYGRPARCHPQARASSSSVGMPDTRTIGEFYKLKHVTDEQLDAAVAEYLNDPCRACARSRTRSAQT
ncbi:hypothetical protein [Methylobacterium nodulans]|uniref:Uncharacterized protein n=1 Tax=Methylobacterium nodulans (strain LMG 21967 / CNCM I-2342 / ORS 2060) TaxID=460265 RepID=B8INP8_METNO|nr:hypothetical protein [Methylobacterium nodulans]ACL58414.1 hypothetical protein Mnod_3503 [Methylobacterium nodulans ORS 2060]